MDKIDTHHHFLPKAYLDAGLASRLPDLQRPTWSPELAIEVMDRNGIAEAILSVPFAPEGASAAAVVRECNEMGASLRARFPGRFGQFATLPLPDVDASLAEAAYCRETLKVDGFVILCRYGSDYLGAGRFDPLFSELDRHETVILTHPQVQGPAPVGPPAMLEYPFDTARAATNLVLNAAHKRYPRLRFILSHAGGVLPYLLPRLTATINMMPGAAEKVGDVAEALRTFYYDTALSGGAATMAALSMIADPERILFGTDWPMAPAGIVAQSAQAIETLCSSGSLPHGALWTNAARLLRRI